MTARFFVDETDLALGKALDEVHGDVVYPGHTDLPEVPRGTLDDAWLARVGQIGLVVITRDQRIRYRPVEKAAWIAHRVRGIVLTGKRSQTTATSQALLDRYWDEIETLIDAEPVGPWMQALTDAGLRQIKLIR